MMSDLEFKIKILKEMNNHIIEEIGDDEITDYWLTYGVPDEASEDDYEFIAENWDSWTDTLKAFTRCLVMNGEM
jgi:hypothetical protein